MTAPESYRTVGSQISGGVPDGPIAGMWERRCADYRLINPPNRRRFTVIVVGTGLAGAGCAATLGELGYNVESFTFHDAPRRAHSVAAQGGINAARARKADGDSITRIVKDTVKGGDYRGREADAQRLGELSVPVIDHLNALGVPFAREYGGSLTTRSFGGVQVSRTYYARSQTGQQLQLAGSQALLRQVGKGTVRLHTRHEMLDLIVADGRAQGIVVRDLVTGAVRPIMGHAVVLATGGYGNVYFKSTLAKASNATAAWRAHRRGALMANPSFVQFHPTSLPVTSRWQSKTTLMSESLRNHGRVWVPLDAADVDLPPGDIPEARRDYYLERRYPAFGNLVPRDVASRNAKMVLDEGRGVGPLHNGVYLDFRDAIERVGRDAIAERYGNLFDLYRDATGEDPWSTPMRIAPGPHFTMGGLWTDYDAMSSIPGLFVGGEASWAYHGANRLGANSLLSASVDGWFVLPWSLPNYLAPLLGTDLAPPDHPAAIAAVADVTSRIERLLSVGGTEAPDRFHARLGEVLMEACGVARSADSLTTGIERIRALREQFWADVRVVGSGARLNQELERAGRIADFMELAELMCIDALDRDESCGAHYRVEHVTADGEARRDDSGWARVSAWEHAADRQPVRHDEPLSFSAVPLQKRSYA